MSTARAANHNGASALAAVARSSRKEAVATDLLREPEEPRSRVESSTESLLFEDEVERDDEMPTKAVEVPRSWLRSDRPPSHRPIDEEDDDAEPTSIVPAAEELELLRQQAAYEEARRASEGDYHGERTIIDQGALHESLARPGEAEPPEHVLAMLERQGVYEPSPRAPDSWAKGAEVPKPAGRVTGTLTVAWLFALAAAVGGYYGFDAWLVRRRGTAERLVAEAAAGTLDGQHESLVEAEGKLLEARSLDPKSSAALDALLFVQTVRALDGAAEELAPVRETLGRAQQAGIDTPLVSFTRGMVAERLDSATAQQAVIRVLDDAAAEPRMLYLAGRLAERAGRGDLADELFSRIGERDPRLAVALLASGEKARGEGRLDDARALFKRALGSDGKNLRAELWLALLEAGPNGGAALLQKLDALAPRIERGSAAERVLALGVRVFALLASGDTARAQAELRASTALRASAPEPLAMFAEQAARAGETAIAQSAASAANQAAGGSPRYRTLLASVMLQQGSGEAAIKALGDASAEAGSLAIVRANAALLSDTRATLESAKRDLAAYRATPDGKNDVDAASLLMRVDMRLGANAESLLPAARSLAQRTPDSVNAHLALGEALVRAEKGAEALAALEAVRRLAPGSAEVHYLVAGAERASGRFKEARSELERAVAIAPNHLEARRSLGRLLLDLGDYEAALTVFRGLEAQTPAAKAGVVEALLGSGQLDAAATELSVLASADKSAPATILLRARLELARGRAQAAADLLAPLVAEQAETRTADSLTLYGEAQLAAGKPDASSSFEAALELDEGHPDALLGRAGAALAENKADNALGFVERAEAALAKRARPPRAHAQLLVLQGRAELAKGAIGPAREHLARAIAVPGAPAEAHFFYAEALGRARDPSAGEGYARYLKLEPNGAYAARAKRALTGP